MDEKEFLREKEKLKDTLRKLKVEEKVLEESLKKTSEHYSKDSYVRAHILYMNEQKLRNLQKIMEKPYFARVDFKQDDEDKIENLYIGKISVLDSNSQDAIIVDWRSPIANLYYDGRIGNASYEVLRNENRRRIYITQKTISDRKYNTSKICRY